MMINVILAIGLILGALGVVLMFMGIPSAARYGYSTLLDVGMGLIVFVFCALVVSAAIAGAVYLITPQPVK